MFSLRNGTPIALIEGGKLNGKTLNIVKEEDPSYEVYEQDPLDVIADLLESRDPETRRTYTEKEIEEIIERLRENEPPPKNRMRIARLYNEAKLLLKEREGREIIVEDGRLRLLPQDDPDQNDRLYVTGNTGSGKSTLIGDWLDLYLQINRGAHVYVFSKKDEDESLDKGINPRALHRFALDESFLEGEPLSSDDLEGQRGSRAVAVFDDIENIKNKDVLKEVKRLRDELLETARSQRIDIVVVSHQIMNWKDTRTTINESTSVTVFPRNGTAHSIKSFLSKYLGLDASMQKRILSLPSRWVTISKTAPRYVLFEKGAFMLD